MIPGARLVVLGTQKSLRKSMHIDRKPSSIIMVIDRIYHPIAQNMGISLLLRNETHSKIQFPPNSFINLVQITGNLVANALKLCSPNGLVDVVFTLITDPEHSTLNMTVTNTGKSISPDLALAFNQGKKVAKLMGTNGEPGIGYRLEYVMELVSKEGGHIFTNSKNSSGTTFSLLLPLPEKYLNRRNGFYPVLKNGEVYLDGS